MLLPKFREFDQKANYLTAQSVGAVEYTDSISSGEVPPPPEYSWYDTKLSDGEEALENVEYSFIAIAPRFILKQNGNT